jgi:hypothetical protein
MLLTTTGSLRNPLRTCPDVYAAHKAECGAYSHTEGVQNRRSHHVVNTKGDFSKELVFDFDLIINIRDVAEGLPLMEYMRWVLPQSVLTDKLML